VNRTPCEPWEMGDRIRSIRIHYNERGYADGLEFLGNRQILALPRAVLPLFHERFRCAIGAQQRAHRLMLYWWMRGIEITRML
jgi:hypothetical protein